MVSRWPYFSDDPRLVVSPVHFKGPEAETTVADINVVLKRLYFSQLAPTRQMPARVAADAWH